MNRTTVLVLALAVLLAHTLAIHVDHGGGFAHPYDIAHAAFRVARNVVREGTMTWTFEGVAVESYPSFLWVALIAVAEGLYVHPQNLAESLGILSALASVVVVAMFDRGRLAGLIAPVMLVVHGGMAAAAASGTETTLFAALATAAFLASEKRRPRSLALFSTLLCLTRPEGVLLVAALLGLEQDHRREAGKEGAPAAKAMQRSFLFPAACVLFMMLVRKLKTGQLLSPTAAGLFEPTTERLSQGVLYIAEFALTFASPLLLLVPLVLLLRRRLRGRGRRALLLALLWILIVVLEGGSSLPMGHAMVPILPIFYLAVQDGLTQVLESEHESGPAVTWVLVLLAVFLSVLASRYPRRGDGTPRVPPLLALTELADDAYITKYHTPVGRLGLHNEIQHTLRLRAMGLFMRDFLTPGASVMAPWPGAIGYLSRRQVYDLLGRATPAGPGAPLLPWYGPTRVDLVHSLAVQPDYILPSVDGFDEAPDLRALTRNWLASYDVHGDDPGRLAQLWRALQPYELVSVPVALVEDSPDAPQTLFYLLRRKQLALGPELQIEVDESGFSVLAKHAGHHQLADLEIWVRDTDGRLLTMRPTGELTDSGSTLARRSILLYPTGSRRILLAQGALPDLGTGKAIAELGAVLRNPGMQRGTDFAEVSRREVHRFR